MNYQKIYNDFIENRKSINHNQNVYCENHHILPKSLGGSNNSDNMVRLSIEDHIHAHVLLGKIHGNRMWGVVSFIMGNAKTYSTPTKTMIKNAAFARVKDAEYKNYWKGV